MFGCPMSHGTESATLNATTKSFDDFTSIPCILSKDREILNLKLLKEAALFSRSVFSRYEVYGLSFRSRHPYYGPRVRPTSAATVAITWTPTRVL